MCWVYILRSERDGRLYTGVTGDIHRRLAEHNRGKVRSTAHRRPLSLVHLQEFATMTAARDRERFLKTPAGGALKRQLVETAGWRLE